MRKLLLKWAGYDRVQKGVDLSPRQSGRAFVHRMRMEFGVRSRILIPDAEPPRSMKSAVFFCTHHTGALDFLAAYPELEKIAPNLLVVVNSQIQKIKPLALISIPVHPISSGKRNEFARTQIREHLKNGGNILVFPAGKVGYLNHGEPTDFPWRTGIAEIARDVAESVVPVYVDARNSRFFYFIRKLFPKLSLLFLLRCLRSHQGKTVSVLLGSSIPRSTFALLTPEELLDEVRFETYSLPQNSKPEGIRKWKI